jgi:hypothetical protein
LQIAADEPDWIDYEDEAAGVKLIVADMIFEDLVADALAVGCTRGQIPR